MADALTSSRGVGTGFDPSPAGSEIVYDFVDGSISTVVALPEVQLDSSPFVRQAAVSVVNTARDGSGDVQTVLVADAYGARVNEIVVKATGNPADCIVTFFLADGRALFLFDELDLNDPAAATASVTGYRTRLLYDNLWLPSGWSLRAAITATPTAGVVNIIVSGFTF